jgi:hypothetical protein
VKDGTLSTEKAHYRYAYADPPYPGQAARWYGGLEVDHRELLERLEAFDGWALSTSARSLRDVLELCPTDIRLGIWNRSNAEPPGNRGRWWWSWEPVIFHGWRPDGPVTRDLVTTHTLAGMYHGQIPGQKPPAFCRWVFNLLGMRAGDELEDLYPGSGAVGYAWDQGVLDLV